MADVTEAQIREAADTIKESLSDGFQWADIPVLVKGITTFAELFSLSGPEKKALALRVAKQVLDETDIPVLPDKLSLPFVGEVGADHLIMQALPGLIDLVVDATKGLVPLNQ